MAFAALAPALLGAGDALAMLGSYLLGSVPFGLLVVRLAKGVDVRTVGSGNIGATNAARAAGRGAGVLVYLLDCGKGAAAVAVVAPLLHRAEGPGLALVQALCGAAAVLGHCFTVFLRFRGGKGVSTACGALLALDPIVFLLGGAAWILALLVWRYVSLASLAMVLAFPLAAWLRGGPAAAEVAGGSALLALLILARHRSNISRIMAGKEPRAFGRRGAVEGSPREGRGGGRGP